MTTTILNGRRRVDAVTLATIIREFDATTVVQEARNPRPKQETVSIPR